MALINRLTRLFRADFHAVLDRIEEPDALLKQAIREMEDELGHDEQRQKLMQQEHRELAAREAELDQSLGELDKELDVCFENGKDDLARALIKRKLEAQRLSKFLARKRAGLEEALSTLDARIRENRAHLDSMRQKAELLGEQGDTRPKGEPWAGPEISVSSEEVDVAFLREQQRRAQS